MEGGSKGAEERAEMGPGQHHPASRLPEPAATQVGHVSAVFKLL